MTDERFCPVCGEMTGDWSPLPETAFTPDSEMTGEEFEDLCMKLLKTNGYLNVSRTRRSGDHGIDILAEKDGISYAIQCKHYAGTVGNKAVQEAYTGKSLYRKDIAVVMTDSFFSEQAVMEARALGVKLWDRAKVIKMACRGDLTA